MEISEQNNTHIQVVFTETDYDFKHIRLSELPLEEKTFFDLHSHDKGEFLFELAFSGIKDLSASVAFLKYISKEFINSVVNDPGFNLRSNPEHIFLSDQAIHNIVNNVPYATGSEYVTTSWVNQVIGLLNQTYAVSCTASDEPPRLFIAHKSNAVCIPSRIYFHLVENKQHDNFPFAFLATYTTIVNDAIVHAPLKNALSELQHNQQELQDLIWSITEIAEKSVFIRHLLDTGDIFYPIKFTNDEAYCFLKEISLYESRGVVCRIPKWYNDQNNSIKLDIDEKKEYQIPLFNKSVINQFTPQLIYHGIPITVEEARILLSRKEGLEQLKGRWIENDHQLLTALLEEYESLVNDGTTLLDVIKNRSGIGYNETKPSPVSIEFSRANFVEEFLNRGISSVAAVPVPQSFEPILRQYQIDAYNWLYALKELGMGACLADDMGLGKTVEVLSFLERIRYEGASRILIIVPATLVDNWRHEVSKFAPDMDLFVLRGRNEPLGSDVNAYLTICTYQTSLKSEYICRVNWDVVILDEAQAIKNYYTAQTKKVKQLKASMRIALTGTPIENNIVELWSIFDFLNPGLLGTRQEFIALYLRLQSRPDGYKDIKALINPFVLRRLKTDKSIISDLPAKNEIDVTISLTKEQIVLYKRVVATMNAGIHKHHSRQEERILVMTTLMKLKQVCNHPSQYYGDTYYDPDLSGKFTELKRICETISEKNERVLVFTQFKEIIPAIDELLEGVFCQKGFTIDGSTSMKKRDEYVQAFQSGEVPYMVLSLKTAGVGLNLTAAQNVIHFDRWWNPAVENQATDRAYRIGQSKNVTVYRFISANTIEEVINGMLKVKQELADSIINDLDGNIISKLSTEELVKAAQYGGFSENEQV